MQFGHFDFDYALAAGSAVAAGSALGCITIQMGSNGLNPNSSWTKFDHFWHGMAWHCSSPLMAMETADTGSVYSHTAVCRKSAIFPGKHTTGRS